ncbi:hypothetical protein [Hahella ganghwensis]|uniref:hypothetical protein n=1 Tax=Hahella ganghwensis TaxID=286420 RepID=UPI0003748F04|nr:hypothetical protein [Hahella ganghwensis]
MKDRMRQIDGEQIPKSDIGPIPPVNIPFSPSDHPPSVRVVRLEPDTRSTISMLPAMISTPFRAGIWKVLRFKYCCHIDTTSNLAGSRSMMNNPLYRYPRGYCLSVLLVSRFVGLSPFQVFYI